jgi:hypothetical protein
MSMKFFHSPGLSSEYSPPSPRTCGPPTRAQANQFHVPEIEFHVPEIEFHVPEIEFHPKLRKTSRDMVYTKHPLSMMYTKHPLSNGLKSTSQRRHSMGVPAAQSRL